MRNSNDQGTSRRQFLKSTTKVAAVSALAGTAIPHVHASVNDTIQIALVGCGGRGTGAASQALSVKNGQTKLVAMADVFESKLNSSFNRLNKFNEKIDVPAERKFLGFDAHKKAMDCLKPGDVVILTTPPAFRWPYFKYAIEKGLHTFMEKPVTVDGPSTRKMIALAKEADKKNLKVGVGLMVRHCPGRQELLKRIQDGEIGEMISMRAYRMGGRACTCGLPPKDKSETLYQIQRFHSFLWASGGMYSDFYIHQVDECSWMKGDWPIKAQATGGRHYRGNDVDQNFDNYSVEYTFPDGTKFFYYGRAMSGCHGEFASYGLGTKGACVISNSGHWPSRVRTYNGHNLDRNKLAWEMPRDAEKNPYQVEWDDLIDAIRNDKPYNEAERGAKASLVTSMGRMAAHTGRIITYDEILNSKHEFAPAVENMTDQTPAPVQLQSDGKYPVPLPGIKKNTEY